MTWRHLRDATYVARKPHLCSLCGLLIAVGERYVLRIGCYDRKLISNHMHEKCEEITRDWDEQDWETAPDKGEFRYLLRK